MFGMLDYRAHKLYIILFSVPLFFINWFLVLGTPIASYAIAKSYADSWWGIFLLCIFAYLVLQIIVTIFSLILGKLIEFVFTLIVDIIPADGRTKKEAKMVTWGGERTIALLDLGRTSPKDWTDEQIESVTKGFLTWFYRDSIIERLVFIREYQQVNTSFVASDWNTEILLKENKLAIPVVENVILNPIYRSMAISAALLLFLVLVQPVL